MDVVITYETLYELFRIEREKPELQKLEPDFFDNVVGYLREKQSALKKADEKDDAFSVHEREKLSLQVSNVRKIIRDLYDRRQRKIIDMALNKVRLPRAVIDVSECLLEEKALFDVLVKVLEDSRKSLSDVLNLKREVKPVSILKSVKFLKHVDAFVGSELEEYGPFEQDEVFELPPHIAGVLVTNGSAVEQ